MTVMQSDAHDAPFEWGETLSLWTINNRFQWIRYPSHVFFIAQDKPPRGVVSALAIPPHHATQHNNLRCRRDSVRRYPLLRRARLPSSRSTTSLVSGIIDIVTFGRCSATRERGARELPLVQKAKRFDGDGPVGYLVMRRLRRLA